MKSVNEYLNEDRNHKYNSISKIKKVLGNQPDVDKVKAFIKKEYDLDNEDHQDIVGDIMGYWHLDPEEFFDKDGNLLEGLFSKKTPKETKKVISKMSDDISKKLTALGKQAFKNDKVLLTALKEAKRIMEDERDLFQESLDTDGDDTDHKFYRDTLVKEIAKYDDIIFGIEKGIW
jgi:hypothetical protein